MIIQTEPFINKEDSQIVKKVLRKGYFTENEYTKNFEDKIKNYTKCKYAIAVSNWTLGLFSCLKAFNIGTGDEVIVPNLTFIATSNSVVLSGAKIVLCDVNIDDMCIDVDQLRKKISRRTKAIIPVHLYGNLCDMDELLKIKKEKNIKIIEDAAQALGAQYKSKFAGTIGDCGGYSFYGNKIITTGEGGVIVTNNKKIAQNIYEIKNHGRKKKGVFIHNKIGFNFMFTELQAALGITQMKKLDTIIKKRKKIFEYYYKFLKNKKIVKFIQKNKIMPIFWFINIQHNYVLKIKKVLKKNKIMTRRLFYPLHLQPCYKKNQHILNINERFENSVYLYKNVLSLPTFHRLSQKKIKQICNEINKFF